MNIMIASDIHGSAYFCEKLLREYERIRPDRLLILGDLLYHGPRNNLPAEYDPKRVIEMLNGLRDSILCVRGNCDAEVDQLVLDFPIMADYCVFYESGRLIYATHGHIYNEDNLLPLKNGDILLNGHTHVPVLREHEDYVYMNPGSVSIPKGESEPGYMTLCDGVFKWYTLSGKEYMRYML